jgi:NitT/TauT family transport system permease protein
MIGRRRGALLLATAGVLSLIAVWKIASVAVGLDIILPPPERVARETLSLVGTPQFLRTLGTTTVRAVLAFVVAVVGAGLLGVAAGRAEWLHRLLSPLMSVVRATPVISVILLALIWFPTGFVPIAVALLMIVPIIYGNVVAGIRQTPAELLEMAALFRVPRQRVLMRIYLPAVRPYVAAALQTAGGITWKVIVAAEVLAQPVFGIGAELQEARVLLATSRVFAWTIVAVVLSALFHLLVTLVFPASLRDRGVDARFLRPGRRNGRLADRDAEREGVEA